MLALAFLIMLSATLAGGFQPRGPLGGVAFYRGGAPGLVLLGIIVIVVAWRIHPL